MSGDNDSSKERFSCLISQSLAVTLRGSDWKDYRQSCKYLFVAKFVTIPLKMYQKSLEYWVPSFTGINRFPLCDRRYYIVPSRRLRLVLKLDISWSHTLLWSRTFQKTTPSSKPHPLMKEHFLSPCLLENLFCPFING